MKLAVAVDVFVGVYEGVRVGVCVLVGVDDGVSVNVGVNVFVREGVIEGVGVKERAAMANRACAVRAPEVVVALTFSVGVDVLLGTTVRVKVEVGGTGAGLV